MNPGIHAITLPSQVELRRRHCAVHPFSLYQHIVPLLLAFLTPPASLQHPPVYHMKDAPGPISPSEAAAALADFVPLSMRSEILRKAGIRVINDCYNANPGSVRAALDLMAEMPVEGRRIAVLGDMLELGEQATALHEDVGRYAVGRVDILLGTGPLSVHTVRAAREAGLEPDRTGHFDDRDSLTRRLKSTAGAGDLVLIKASRGLALEHVAKAL